MNIFKLSASGNKFLLVDYRKDIPLSSSEILKTEKTYQDFLKFSSLSEQERQKEIRDLKDASMEGIGILKPSSDSTCLFECDFYNKDGSMAEMCGNLTSCLIFYARQTGLTEEENFCFLLAKDKLQAQGKWSILEKPEAPIPASFKFKDASVPYYFVRPGVPHAVIEGEVSKDIIQSLRKDKTFSERGMNVSCFSVKKGQHLQARSFERGVEDFTQACGSGALACSLVFSKTRNTYEDVQVEMPGGCLQVQLQPSLALFSEPKWGY